MFRGRKRKLPFLMVETSSSDSEDDPLAQWEQRRLQRQRQQEQQRLREQQRLQQLNDATRAPIVQQPEQVNEVRRGDVEHHRPDEGQQQPENRDDGARYPAAGGQAEQQPEQLQEVRRGYVQHHRPEEQPAIREVVVRGQHGVRRQHGVRQQPNEEDVILVPHENEEEGNMTVEEGEDEEEEYEDEEEEEEEELNMDYQTLLDLLSQKWLVAEVDHTMSKAGSNELWRIASFYIPKIINAKNIEQVKKKNPQFNHIRRKLYDDYTPKVNLEIGYRNKETNEVTVVKDSITPRKRFPPNQFEKLYEIASVKVTF